MDKSLVSEVRSLLTYAFSGQTAPTFTDDDISRALASIRTHEFSEPEKDIALGGEDGKKAEHLLRHAVSQGATTLRELTRRAVLRLLQRGALLKADTLFDQAETDALAEQILRTNAPAELLGRARIRERHEDIQAGVPKRTPFFTFDDAPPLGPMVPTRALEHFRALVPKLDVDPATWIGALEERAFTMAVAIDQVVLEKVKAYIASALETGEVSTGPEDIDEILDAAGVGERENGYSEMIFRTNLMSAFTTGSQDEALEVAETFPVWMYSNPDDGRSRPSHAARNRKYYPNAIGSTFKEVRGEGIEDAANCRCVPQFLDVKDWQERQATGAAVETEW